MVEQGFGIEDAVLGLAQEARHSDSVEDDPRRRLRRERIERMARQVDLLESDSAPLQRREKRLEPERVLVKDGEIGHGQSLGENGRAERMRAIP
jgi:hypothetical protein